MQSPVPVARPVALIAAAKISWRGDPTASSTKREGWASTKSTASPSKIGFCSKPNGGLKCAGAARPQRSTSAGRRSGGNPMMVTRSSAPNVAPEKLPGQIGAGRNHRRDKPQEAGGACNDAQIHKAQERALINRPKCSLLRETHQMIGVRRDHIVEGRVGRPHGDESGRPPRIDIRELQAEQPYVPHPASTMRGGAVRHALKVSFPNKAMSAAA